MVAARLGSEEAMVGTRWATPCPGFSTCLKPFHADNTSKLRAVGKGADFLTLYPQPLYKQPIYKLFEAIAFT